jgi:hypothetical protein
MAIVIAWILASALVGYLGRYQRGRFWGFFLFSLLLSPVVGGLGLLLARPVSRPAAARLIERRRVVAALPEGPVTRLAHRGLGALLVAWGLVVLSFGVVFWVLTGSALRTALQLSFDVATLGVGPLGIEGVPRMIVGIERLAVLLLIALLVARFVSAYHARAVHVLGAAAGEALPDFQELQAAVRRQDIAIAELRALVEPAPGEPVTASARSH